MTPRTLSPEAKKATRLTVLFTEAEMARLERVAAYYALPKSVAAHDMIMRILSEDVQTIDESSLAAVEEKQDDWRMRMGLA